MDPGYVNRWLLSQGITPQGGDLMMDAATALAALSLIIVALIATHSPDHPSQAHARARGELRR